MHVAGGSARAHAWRHLSAVAAFAWNRSLWRAGLSGRIRSATAEQADEEKNGVETECLDHGDEPNRRHV